MGIEHPLGLEVVPCPHASLTTEEEQNTILKDHNVALFLFQNPSEVSDEELNDDLLQSDDEDVNMR